MPRPASSVPCSDWPVATRTALPLAEAAPVKTKTAAPRRAKKTVAASRSMPTRASINTPESRLRPSAEVARNIAEDAARRGMKAVQLAQVHQVAPSVIYQIFSDVRAGRLEVQPDVRAFLKARAHSAPHELSVQRTTRTPTQILTDLRTFANSEAETLSDFVAARRKMGKTSPTRNALALNLEDVLAGSVKGLSKQDREKILEKMKSSGIGPIPGRTRKTKAKAETKAKVVDTPKPAKTKPAKSVKTAPKAPAAGSDAAGMLVLSVAPDGTRRAELPGSADPEMLKTVLAWLG